MVAAALAAGFAFGVTPGWEDVHPGRKPFKHLEPLVWQADFSVADAFVLEKHDGAEGEMTVLGRGIRVVKTNREGFLVVKAKGFAAPTNQVLMLSADVAVKGATSDYSIGFLRACGEKTAFGIQWDDRTGEPTIGWPQMSNLINTAPGMSYRKYYTYHSVDGTVTPMLIVAGYPSTSVWANWAAEDYYEAKKLWKKEGMCPNPSYRRKPDLVPDDEFDRMIAADIDHTAKMEKWYGVGRLLIDGKPAIPSVYEGMRHLDDFTEINDARGLIAAGVPLAGPIVIGASNKSQEESITWTKDGYNAKLAVDLVRETMRASGDALLHVQYSCNAYPEFTQTMHPDEIWRDEKGNPIVGNFISSVEGYAGFTATSDRWPWPSMASPHWREAVKSNIRAFVAEMKRRGLSKRLVSIHFCGYNDGQFGMNRPDYSPCARAEYAKYLEEIRGTGLSTNYWHFCRQLTARTINDFGLCFKEAMGKDVVVLRRGDSPFVVEFAIGANTRLPGIDVTVTGPTYTRRDPGVSCTTFVPFSSHSLAGRMVWNEFDLRTQWVIQSDSVINYYECNPYADIERWQAGYRKLAGEMIAVRGGYWFYDMGRGWFSAPGVCDDVADSFKTFRHLTEKKPSSWRPDTAIVVDEEGFFGWDGGQHPYPGHTYELVERQLHLLANSGVPYDYYFAEDVIRDPSLLREKKAVFFLLMRKVDARRAAMLKELRRTVPTLVYLAEAASLGEDEEAATGFKTGFSFQGGTFGLRLEKEMTCEPRGVLDIQMLTGGWFGMKPEKTLMEPTGRRGWVEERPGVTPLASYWDTKQVAIARRDRKGGRDYYHAVPAGMSPEFFNHIVREAGGYAPVGPHCLQVNMNGDFISVHALATGKYDFRLPFACRVVNVKSGTEEKTVNGILKLDMTAGQTCWFLLEK